MTDYSNLKVVELKELLKERGIATSAKLKKDIIEALEANDNDINDTKSGEPLDFGDDVQAEAGKSNGAGVPMEPATAQVAAMAEADDGNGTGSDSETRKRKRRSPSPAPNIETVKKKLKAIEEDRGGLPEDEVDYSSDHLNEASAVEAEPVPDIHDDTGDESDEQEKETVKEDANVQESGKDTIDISVAAKASEGNKHQQDEDQHAKDTEVSVEPAKHPATRALYIRELVRPLQPSLLQQHLASVAQGKGDPNDAPAVKSFYLDKLRTHALVVFTSISAASRARVSVHGKIWPAEPQRKPLWADFVPEDKVQEWIDTESSRSEMIRWEVTYEFNPDGSITASLEALAPTRPAGDSNRRPSGGPSQPPRRPSLPNPDIEMSDFPAGGGGGDGDGGARRDSNPQPQPSAFSPPSRLHAGARPSSSSHQNKPFDSLDARFRFTDAKPKLYYQPVSRELADRRLRELHDQTSRDWKFVQTDHASSDQAQLRRYTFEDDRLVDGGPDFGNFGRNPSRSQQQGQQYGHGQQGYGNGHGHGHGHEHRHYHGGGGHYRGGGGGFGGFRGAGGPGR